MAAKSNTTYFMNYYDTLLVSGGSRELDRVSDCKKYNTKVFYRVSRIIFCKKYVSFFVIFTSYKSAGYPRRKIIP